MPIGKPSQVKVGCLGTLLQQYFRWLGKLFCWLAPVKLSTEVRAIFGRIRDDL